MGWHDLEVVSSSCPILPYLFLVMVGPGPLMNDDIGCGDKYCPSLLSAQVRFLEILADSELADNKPWILWDQ